MNGRELQRQTRLFNRCADGMGVVACVLVALMAWLLVLKPIDAAIAQDGDRKEAAENDITNRDAITSDTARLRQERADYETRLETLLNGIPESVQDSQFLGQVATLARESELLLEQFRPGTIESVGEYQQLEIELTASGTHKSICRFLDGLAKLPRMCRVPEIHIDASGEDFIRAVAGGDCPSNGSCCGPA
jgi:Tfp pilus assembly protein PilO